MNPINRRDFISAAALACLFPSRHGFAAPRDPGDGVYDCIVLGAGIAGLTAARNLQERGLSVLVLEGHNRIGGRIHTVRDANLGPLELGAEYIHRPPGTVPLWREVTRYGLPTQEIPRTTEGRIYSPEFADLPLRGKLRRPGVAALRAGPLQTALMFPKIESYDGPDLTPRQWVKWHYGGVPMQEDFASMLLTGHLPGTMDDLSIRGFRADDIATQLQDRNEYYLTRGYHSLLAETAKGLDVRTAHVVDKVRIARDGVTVNVGAKQFRARTTLCTFSVGMLKAIVKDSPDFFEPRLPALTTSALSRIEAGHHTKIALVFDRRFWPAGLAMLHNPGRTRRAGRTYFRPFYDDDRRPVLTAYLLAEDAMRLDAMSEADAIRTICADLSEIFDVNAQSYLRYFHRFRWKMDDALARGGFTYLTVNGDQTMPVESARLTLARASLTAPLFLAGEATAIETQPSSVHGAHASAWRATWQIAQYLRDGRFLTLDDTTRAVRGLR